MNDLIKALKIFQKYTGNITYPTACEYDILYVMCDPAIVSEEDKDTLDELGFDFDVSGPVPHFYSYRFGSVLTIKIR